MLNETCQLLVNVTQPYDVAKHIVKSQAVPLFLWWIIPLFAMLICGLATGSIKKGNFWALFVTMMFSEVLATGLYVFMVSI